MAALRKISIPVEHLSILLALLPKGVRPIGSLESRPGEFTVVVAIGGKDEPEPASNADIPTAQIRITDQPGKRVVEIVDASPIIKGGPHIIVPGGH